MSSPSPDPQGKSVRSDDTPPVRLPSDSVDLETPPSRHADLSVWLVWAVLMLVAIAILPFAVRNQDVVGAIARMCGFDLG